MTFDLRLGQIELMSPQRLFLNPETYSPHVPPLETWTIGIAAKLKEENLVVINVGLYSLIIAEYSVRQVAAQLDLIGRIAGSDQFWFFFGKVGETCQKRCKGCAEGTFPMGVQLITPRLFC